MAELTRLPQKINRYQILVMLLTAAVTYRGLTLLMPSDRAERGMEPALDRIHAVQAQSLPSGPVVQVLPLQTQIVRSSRGSSRKAGHHARTIPGHSALRSDKPQAEVSPLDLRSLGVHIDGIEASTELGNALPEEIRRRLALGLVPEAIVLPRGEEYEVSSLILIKPHHAQKSVVRD